MLKPLASALGTGLWSAVGRFPVPFLCALAFCIISIFLPGYGQSGLGERKDEILAILFCTTFWFISSTLVAESRGWRKLWGYALAYAGAGAIGAYLWMVPKIEIPFSLLGAACFLSMFIAPFLRSGVSADAIWVFNYRLWLRIAVSVLVGLVLFLGLLAISQSFKFLFGVEQPYDMAGNIWLFVATFVSPVFAMAGIPRDFDAGDVDYPKPIRMIVSFILLPLLLVYAVTLYLYTGKIVATWTLPEGGVVYLVSGFGIVGTIAWLASVPLHTQSGFVATFARNFYRILLLPLALLFVGIGIRIKEYGVTEERYVVVLCLLWLVLSSAFALVATSRHAPRFIYLSLISLLFLASVGPWGAMGLSNFSQLGRLEAALIRVGLIVDGQPQALKTPPGVKEQAEISALMDYFADRERLDEVLPLLGLAKDFDKTKPDVYNAATPVQTALKQVGIPYIVKWERDLASDGTRTVWYRRENVMPTDTYDVRGFDYLLSNGYLYQGPDSDKSYTFSRDLTLDASMDWGSMVLTFTDKHGGREVKFALAEGVKAYDVMQTVIAQETQGAGGLSLRLNVRDFNAQAGFKPGSDLKLNSLSYELYVKDER